MKLLWVTNVYPSPPLPTQGAFNFQLVKALAERGHAVRVICPMAWTAALQARRGPGDRGLALPSVDGVGLSYPRFYFTPKLMRRFYGTFMWLSVRRCVRRQLIDFRPDAVIGYWIHPDGEVAVRAAAVAGVPSVVMVGGSDLLLLTHDRSRQNCILRVLHAADAVVPVSGDLRDKMLGMGVPAGKIAVVPRGVDTTQFAPGDRTAARQRLNLPGDGPVLVWVGRMVPVKGLDVLLRALAELKHQGVCPTLFLVGGGPLRDELRSQASELKLDRQVHFVGKVAHAELGDWYRAANLTVLPSRSEGIPNVLRESLACGTAFVASRVGGVSEIAGDGRCVLVPADDARALADGIRDGLKRAETGVSTVSVVQQTWAESADALVEVVRPLLTQARRPTGDPLPRPAGMIGQSPNPLKRVATAAATILVPQRRLLRRGPIESKQICLTFDDGPHPEQTPRLLDVLKRAGVHATFFMVGRRMERFPAIVRRTLEDGHAVGSHSFDHAPPVDVSARRLAEEVERSERVFESIAGRRAGLFRPPHGKLTAAKLWRLWRAGQRVVMWNVDPKDYACTSAGELAGRLDGGLLRGGDIVLLHDVVPYAAEVLPQVIDAARAGGLAFGTVGEWLEPGPVL